MINITIVLIKKIGMSYAYHFFKITKEVELFMKKNDKMKRILALILAGSMLLSAVVTVIALFL